MTEVVIEILDLIGESLLAVVTTAMVILIMRQNRENEAYYKRLTRPTIVINTEKVGENLFLRFKNWGGGPALDVRALVGDDDDEGGPLAVNLGLMPPSGEHAEPLGPVEGAFAFPFRVALYYGDREDVAHFYDLVANPHIPTAVSVVGEAHQEAGKLRGSMRRRVAQ